MFSAKIWVSFCVGVVGSPSHEWVEREIPWTSDIPFDIERYVLIATREVDAEAYRREQSCIIPFGPFPGVDKESVGVGVFHPQACGGGESLAPLCPPRCIHAVHHLTVFEAVALFIEIEVIDKFGAEEVVSCREFVGSVEHMLVVGAEMHSVDGLLFAMPVGCGV